MSKYRINVRFETDDPKQAEAVKFLQSLEYSRNAFIVSAVLDAVSGKSAVNNISLENRSDRTCSLRAAKHALLAHSRYVK